MRGGIFEESCCRRVIHSTIAGTTGKVQICYCGERGLAGVRQGRGLKRQCPKSWRNCVPAGVGDPFADCVRVVRRFTPLTRFRSSSGKHHSFSPASVGTESQ
jgi:hypothetical protein